MGLQFYTGAADEDGCNPVAMTIHKEVQESNAINAALVNLTACDYRDALFSFDHLDTITVDDMNSRPRDFDSGKTPGGTRS